MRIFLILSLCVLGWNGLSAQYFSQVINFGQTTYDYASKLAYDGDSTVFVYVPRFCEPGERGDEEYCRVLLSMNIDGNINNAEISDETSEMRGFSLNYYDSLLYYGAYVNNESRDSQVILRARRLDGEVVWSELLDTTNSWRGTSKLFFHRTGFLHSNFIYGGCEPERCDTSIIRFYDWDRNLIREWEYISHPDISRPNFDGSGIIQLTNNDFIATSTGGNSIERYGSMIRFDSLGNIKWQKYTLDEENPNNNLLPIAPLPDNRYMVLWERPYDDWRLNNVPLFLGYNAEGEREWELHYSWDTLRTEIYGMTPLENGDVLAFGKYNVSFLGYAPEWEECGYMARISPAGELLWERKICDGRETHPLFKRMHFQDAVELNNGDFILGGTISLQGLRSDYDYDNAVWLVRTDSLGCLEPGCSNTTLITDTEEIQQAALTTYQALRTWPNPTTGPWRVELMNPDLSSTYTLRLHDTEGQEVRRIEAQGQQFLEMDLSALPAGLYLWQVWQDGVLRYSGKVVR